MACECYFRKQDLVNDERKRIQGDSVNNYPRK